MLRKASRVHGRQIVLTVLLAPDQARRVDEIAAAGRRSRSFVVRDLLDTALVTLRQTCTETPLACAEVRREVAR